MTIVKEWPGWESLGSGEGSSAKHGNSESEWGLHKQVLSGMGCYKPSRMRKHSVRGHVE